MIALDVADLTEGLSLGDDGIWRATDRSDVSYPASGHSACLAVEENSFWFNHRNDCIRAVVSALPPTEGKPMLDVGGGNGYVSLGLARAGIDVILVEPGETGAENARRRGLDHVICATTETAGIRPGSVGAIGLFDVVEHIDDDRSFMTEMCELLSSGDRLYATVPAYQFLWSADDEKAGHHRRYSLDEITSLFESVGFDVDHASYFFRPLPAPVFLLRAVPYRFRSWRDRSARPPDESVHDAVSPDILDRGSTSTQRSHAANRGTIASVIRRLLRPEISNIERLTSMRFGGSILVAAHRR
ncbi:class I SAM-dependent methyltransferase [Ilumatobacter sp.]|uniref:class I SAM-dependent methyltransferase n=1 Tax=Ilumatobacter sp. TaxID=1967498 RepID=UPI003AF5B623